MSHNHNHSHSSENVSDSVLLWCIIVNLGLSVFEFVGGVIAGSVALMADAAHNTNDAAALLIAYIARKISKKGADAKYTFGYRRAELIGAMIQLTALILVGLYLVYEAVRRIFEPEPLLGGWIMAAAGVAVVVDVVTAWLLWAMSKGSLNVKAAFLHNLTDAGASVAVLIGGATIYWLDWSWVDPLISLGIAGYILYMSFGLLKKTSRILMEGTPPELSLDEIKEALEDLDGVENVHHIHLWELDERHRALEAHVVIGENRSMEALESLKAAVKEHLDERFSITHSTLEFESAEKSCGGKANGEHCSS
jgi:cobalt-zinc-cadmium efflux system protein